MRCELLVVDLLLLTLPLVASFGRKSFFLDRFAQGWTVAGALCLPGWALLAWLCARGELSFSPEHSLVASFGPLGLPPGALFIVPAAGFAAMFGWAVVFAERPALPLATLLRHSSFWIYLGCVALMVVALEGALIQRGIVTRTSAWVPKLINVPLVDLGLASLLAGSGVLGFEHLELRAAASTRTSWIARMIESRFGGYRHTYNTIDTSLPEQLEQPKRVAVVGAGLAGMGAATRLAERGFAVSLYERNPYLGGKLGAWKTTLESGQELSMNHGFHAFFKQYYNLNHWLGELEVTANYRSIGDYMILTRDGRSYSFAEVSTTPILNLLSLARHGVYKLREVAGRHTGPKMEALMRYDIEQTYAQFDNISYAQFAEDARLPESLQLVFNTFSRAFFSDADKMSMAELIKSFHFYYLSNDGGLIYDTLNDDFEVSLLSPLREAMLEHGVEIHLDSTIESISREADGRFEVEGEHFDYLVIASDVVGTRALFEASPSLQAAAPKTANKCATLRPGQRYAVWRVWLDRPIERELPGFFVTERSELLDSLTLVDKNELESQRWVEARVEAGLQGSVMELHCYAMPISFSDDPSAIKTQFLAELHHFFPELAQAEIVHDYFYVRQDFPSFHVGQHETRPSWDTDLDNLFLAGDWVTLPFPAMLMEAAYTAGLLSANAIARREGVRETPVWSVPLRGFMARSGKR